MQGSLLFSRKVVIQVFKARKNSTGRQRFDSAQSIYTSIYYIKSLSFRLGLGLGLGVLVSKACSAHVRSKTGPGLENSILCMLVGTASIARWLIEEMNVSPNTLLNASTRAGKLEVLQGP